MKTLKFKPDLVSKVLDGSKTTTWRIDDDKDLQEGDEIVFLNSDTKEKFAKAKIVYVRSKKLGEVEEQDFDEGHERYESKEAMIESYRSYYGKDVTLDSDLKIIKFAILE